MTTATHAPITVTLAAIRAHYPCEDGWKKLVKHLGGVHKAQAIMDAPLRLSVVLDSNGLANTIWCFRALDSDVVRKRLVCLWLADVLEHAAEKKPNKWLADGAALLRRYERGEATIEQLKRLRAAAYATFIAYAAVAYADAAPAAAAYATYVAAAAAANTTADASYAYAAAAADAAADASYAAVYAVSTAERKWQSIRLREYLEGER